MVSFFRRRKPAALSLFDREAVGPDIAVVQSAVGEPEQEKLAVVDSEPGKLPPVLPEPDEVEAKAMPAEFVSVGPAVSDLYAIPNLGVEFAIAQESPGESAVEIDEDSEPAHEENLAEKPAATEGDVFAQEALSIWRAVAAAGNSVSRSPAKRAPAETEDDLEPSGVESLPDQSVAGHDAETAEEFKAVEEPLIEDTLPTESASADEVPIEDAATDSPVAEAAVEIVSIEPVVPEVTEVGSSTSDEVEREVAHRLAVLEDALRRQASAAPSKPKRRWWSFWRKRQPVEQSVVAGELFAIEAPVIESAKESSAPGEIAAAEQVEDLQLLEIGSKDSAASEEVALAENASAAQTSAEKASTETQREPECLAAQDMPEGSVIGLDAAAAEESLAVEEPATEETLSVGADASDMLPSGETSTDTLVAEAGAEIVPTELVASEAAEIESQDSEPSDSELADSSPATVDVPPTTADTVPHKRERRWWNFWGKRDPVGQSVLAGGSSAIDSPVVGPESEVSAPGEIVTNERGADLQLSAIESKDVDAWGSETIVGESSASESSTENPSLGSDIPDVTDIELPTDVPVTYEAAELESHDDAPLPLDVPGIESTEVEPPSESGPSIEDASEISTPVTQAGEIAEDGNASTTEESALVENIQIESAANEAEEIALALDSPTIEPDGIEAAADVGNAERPPTETGDSMQVSQGSIPEPAVTSPTAAESEIIAGAHSSEVPTSDADISIAEPDAPESKSPAAREEEILASVSEVREASQSRVQWSQQGNPSADGLGLLDLPRVAEPEVMDDSEEVEAYASATAQAWLKKIDDSFVEHAVRLVKGRQRGRALDIGTGPGQIALKLALRLSLWKVIGVDHSQKMIDEALAKLAATARVTGRLEFRVADGNRLDFPNATFDLVICNSVLHHFAEPRNLLAELARVTKPRGAILLRDLRRPSRLAYQIHVRWHGRHYDGAMGKLYRDSVRAAYTVPELQRLLDASPLRGARVFRHGSTHIGLERPCS